jgi:Zn-dependent protease
MQIPRSRVAESGAQSRMKEQPRPGREAPDAIDVDARPGGLFRVPLGRVPVWVDPGFLLVSVVLGWVARRDIAGMTVWGGSFVLALFVHELAHAVVARLLGASGEVWLTFRRPALNSSLTALSTAGRFAVHMAGPAVSLALGAIVLALAGGHPPFAAPAAGGVRFLGWVSVGWGLFNCVPLLPLDAGHALAAVLDGPTKGRGERPVRWASIACAVAFALVCTRTGGLLPAAIGALVALHNAQALLRIELSQREAAARKSRGTLVRVHLQAAYEAAARGEARAAIRHCRTVLEDPMELGARRDALRLLAYAYATGGEWGQLIDLLESGGAGAFEPEELDRYERAARELGRAEDARRLALLRSVKP